MRVLGGGGEPPSPPSNSEPMAIDEAEMRKRGLTKEVKGGGW